MNHTLQIIIAVAPKKLNYSHSSAAFARSRKQLDFLPVGSRQVDSAWCRHVLFNLPWRGNSFRCVMCSDMMILICFSLRVWFAYPHSMYKMIPVHPLCLQMYSIFMSSSTSLTSNYLNHHQNFFLYLYMIHYNLFNLVLCNMLSSS